MSATLDTLDLDAQPQEEYLGPHGGVVRYSTNTRGLRIASYYWPAHRSARPRGIIVAIHGWCSGCPGSLVLRCVWCNAPPEH